MAFGFPAYHTEHYSPGTAKAKMQEAIRSTVESLEWKIRIDDVDGFEVSTGVNFRSWGEKVVIDFMEDHSISVTSKCALPTQCIDWGKNKANVNKFLAELKGHL